MKLKVISFMVASTISSLGLLHAENLEQITCNQYTLEGSHKMNENNINATVYDFGKIDNCPITISIADEDDIKNIYNLNVSVRNTCIYQTRHSNIVCRSE